MRLELPSAQQAPFILRAFKAVIAASATADPRQRKMLIAARDVLGSDVDVDGLAPIAPADLAEAVASPRIRSQIISGMVVLSLLDEEAEASELALIDDYATALEVAPDELRNLRQLVGEQTMALRLDVARRVWFVDKLRAEWNRGGFKWLARSVATLKLSEDKPMAEKYRALGELPEGSLGRCYYDHMREQGFPIAGEKGSQVEPVFIHDLTHLLSGYGTDAPGEILAASFSAGNRGKDPFTYIFFVLCQFHLGMKFSPFAPAAAGNFDPAAALWAAKRGMEVNIDLTEDWDFWSDLALPIPAVRQKLGMTLPEAPPTSGGA